jgi:hypothetical protein
MSRKSVIRGRSRCLGIATKYKASDPGREEVSGGRERRFVIRWGEL